MKKIIVLGLLLISGSVLAQEHHEETAHAPKAEQHHDFKHSIALMLGHTHIFEGRDEEDKRQWLAVPSFALDYNYLINEKWAVGIHSDIIIESFVVERHLGGGEEEELIERNYPIASLLMGSYKFAAPFIVTAGVGGEFDSGENFFMYRLGLEAGFHLHDPSWEFITGINYDIKINGYDIWNLTAGIAKRF